MRIRRFKRKLAPVMRIFGDPDADGMVPVISPTSLRRIRREQRERTRNRNPTDADKARIADAESKRERKRTRNLEGR